MGINKPKIGQPCNGCGLCCQIQVCRNGAYVLGLVRTLGETVKGPCPALVKKFDGSFTCGIVSSPKKYFKKSRFREEVLRKHFTVLIGAGHGCDEPGYEPTPEEEEALDKLVEKVIADPEFKKKVQEAMRIIYDD